MRDIVADNRDIGAGIQQEWYCYQLSRRQQQLCIYDGSLDPI